jgi:hypothetical protein
VAEDLVVDVTQVRRERAVIRQRREHVRVLHDEPEAVIRPERGARPELPIEGKGVGDDLRSEDRVRIERTLER